MNEQEYERSNDIGGYVAVLDTPSSWDEALIWLQLQDGYLGGLWLDITASSGIAYGSITSNDVRDGLREGKT